MAKETEIEDLVAQLIEKTGGADAAKAALAKTKLTTVADKFAAVLRGGPVALTVSNWPAIEAFRHQPVSADNAPALVLDDILRGIEDAATEKDATAFLENLLLCWKAVRRG